MRKPLTQSVLSFHRISRNELFFPVYALDWTSFCYQIRKQKKLFFSNGLKKVGVLLDHVYRVKRILRYEINSKVLFNINNRLGME